MGIIRSALTDPRRVATAVATDITAMTQGVIMQRVAVLLAFTASLFLCAPVVLAQNSASSALINQQLDKQAKLQLNGTLPDVMTQITKQTGVPVEAQPEVWDLLPWGRETTVTAKIENQTLREALEVI